MRKLFFIVLAAALVYLGYYYGQQGGELGVGNNSHEEAKELAEQLTYDMAKAWEQGDVELLKEIMHEDIVFAYPGRRLNYDDVVADLEFYKDAFSDTKVYIHNIITEGDRVAVEWQFAATKNENGKRTAVSDGIIGKIQDGKIIEWKEYLDGRVSRMQEADELPLEEGEEPFPWPKKPEQS